MHAFAASWRSEAAADRRCRLGGGRLWPLLAASFLHAGAADAGGESVGRWPRDGAVWIYDVDGSISRAGGRHAWVNPSLLDMDEWGTLYVVDKGAGRPMPGTNNQWHFDAIYKTGMPVYRFPKALYATAPLAGEQAAL